MNTTPNQFDLSLAHQAMFEVTDAAGVQITCRQGSLWLTLDGDARDIVIDTGESFTATEHRRALIYALAPSDLSVAMGPTTVATNAPARSVGRARWVEGTRVTFGLQSA